MQSSFIWALPGCKSIYFAQLESEIRGVVNRRSPAWSRYNLHFLGSVKHILCLEPAEDTGMHILRRFYSWRCNQLSVSLGAVIIITHPNFPNSRRWGLQPHPGQKTETVLVSISVSVASISHRAAQLSSQWKPQSHLRFIYWLAENKPESEDETKGINKEQKGQTSEFAPKVNANVWILLDWT